MRRPACAGPQPRPGTAGRRRPAPTGVVAEARDLDPVLLGHPDQQRALVRLDRHPVDGEGDLVGGGLALDDVAAHPALPLLATAGLASSLLALTSAPPPDAAGRTASAACAPRCSPRSPV